MEMEENSKLMKIYKVTPKVEDLVPYKQISCTECEQTFLNIGNLQMHLTRHHKKNQNDLKLIICGIKSNYEFDQNSVKIYYCPVETCIYNQKFKCGGRYFTKLKYIRQHFQKVHIEKTFQCKKCSKMFATLGLCEAHELNCGKLFQCRSCERNYSTREALLTHGKRKNHVTSTIITKVEKSSPRIKRKFTTDKKMASYQVQHLDDLNKLTKNEKLIGKQADKKPKVLEERSTHVGIANKKNINLQKSIVLKRNDVEDNQATYISSKLSNVKHDEMSPVELSQHIKTNPTPQKICNFVNATSDELLNSSPPFSDKSIFNTDFNKIYNDKQIILEDLTFNKSTSTYENQEAFEVSQNSNALNDQNPNLNETRNKQDKRNVSPTRLIFEDENQDSPNYKMSQTSGYYEDSCFDQLVNYCHMETQTEFSSPLEYYSHNETQTYDDFFNELGLADIQTQTNWSDVIFDQCNNCGNLMNNGNEKKQAAVQCSFVSHGVHDELLVSTETQTSFTQCLLNSGSGGSVDPTQVSNELDELLNETSNFNFQSTFTQT